MVYTKLSPSIKGCHKNDWIIEILAYLKNEWIIEILPNLKRQRYASTVEIINMADSLSEVLVAQNCIKKGYRFFF